MALQSLNNALSGLRAAQSAIDLTANNIANAGTPGYTRKILPQEAHFTSVNALGVRVREIMRSVDMSLLREMFGQSTRVAELGIREQYLSRIQSFHGPSEAERSIGAVLNRLQEDFIALSAEPENSVMLGNAVNTASETARQFNRFSDLLQQMRNDAQADIANSVAKVNAALEKIADLNRKIGTMTASGKSTALLEDQRDNALRVVTEHMDISFFKGDNNKITVMTKSGQTLADTTVRPLVFQPTQQTPATFYPGGGSAGLFIGGTDGFDLTDQNIGGRIGGLLQMRDEILPQYQAQIDELAQKTAARFAAQGLALFTDPSGNVPPSATPPDPVTYVGFSAVMQVNPAVLADPTLLRSGTEGATVPPGSNEVIRKIVDFAFGSFSSQQAQGNVDLNAAPTIFGATGMTQTAQFIGNENIAALGVLTDHPDINPGDQFTITIGGGLPQNITINAGDTATDLVNSINAVMPGTARLNGLGQLVLEAGADITLANASLPPAGFAALGLTAGTTPGQNPSFTIRAGLNNPVTVIIEPTDTAADILNTLNAVPGITAQLNGDGELVITPVDGGDLTLTDGTGAPLAAMGVSISGVPHEAFRETELGPNGDINLGLTGLTSLVQYAQGMVGSHAETHQRTTSSLDGEQIFFNALEQRMLNESGVDLDQELAKLIELQTAYSASARMIAASEQMFNTLLNAVR